MHFPQLTDVYTYNRDSDILGGSQGAISTAILGEALAHEENFMKSKSFKFFFFFLLTPALKSPSSSMSLNNTVKQNG